MQRISHGALVYFSLDLVGGPKKFQEYLQALPTAVKITAISSIYKRFRGKNQADLNASMDFVVKVITDKGPEDFLAELMRNAAGMEVILLAFDDLILMSPHLTLPYPELHTNPLIIRCAAEAWGSYEHPVYQKTLSEISRSAQAVTDAEFFLQGRNLIDI